MCDGTRQNGGDSGAVRQPKPRSCEDLTTLNTSRLILDSVGPALLYDIVNDFHDLLATSAAVYERNGDYALGIVTSGWCRFLDRTSRKLCGPVDDREALASGKWLCRESCWSASRRSIETGEPVDVECRGGIRLCAMPIRARNDVVGSVNFAYGDPPRDPDTLAALAATFGADVAQVRRKAAESESHPPFIVDLARKRLRSAARLIGEIVERRRAEEALRKSTETLRAVFQASPAAITVIDMASRLTMWNATAERMFGWKEEEVLGKPLAITPRGGEAEHLGFREMASRGESVTAVEVKRLHKDGTLVDVELSTAPFHDSTGTVCGAVGILMDITERKRAEEALRKLSRADEEALRVARMAHWEFDVTTGMFTFNDQYYALHGFTAPQIGGYRMDAERFARDFVYPEDSWLVGDAIRQAVEAADPGFQLMLEARIMRADGEPRWATVWFRIEKDASGRTIRLYGVNQDINERKRAEETMRFTQFVMDRSGEVAFWTAPDGRIIYVNEAGCRSLGYAREELLSMRVADFDPDFTPEVWAAHWEDIKRRGSFTIETRHRTRDGRVFPVEVRVNFVKFEGREYNCAFVRDLAERRRAEDERLKLEGRMRDVQKLESLGVLAGGIAHDFNNILMAILGNADLALQSLSSAVPARANIEEIERASKRAADLCRQMLAYSGKGRFIVGRYDLSEIIREMGRMLEISISKRASLRYALAGNLPPVEVDATQLRQVVMNLITNASEALGEDGGVISVSSGVVDCDRGYLSESYLDDRLPEGRYVFMEVSDSGCGMDAATRQRIFDPFFTTKFAGRGLGLAAVLGIVRGHKGAVKVCSEPGQGTTFKLLLPAAEWTSEDRQPAAEQKAAPYGGGTVLLVDDDSHVRGVGSAMLNLLGFEVLTAADGREAVETFRARGKEIVLVILDLTMPEMGGEDAFRAIRRLRGDVRVVLSSGYSEDDVFQRFSGKGLTGFLQKPYSVATLRETLDRIFL